MSERKLRTCGFQLWPTNWPAKHAIIDYIEIEFLTDGVDVMKDAFNAFHLDERTRGYEIVYWDLKPEAK